MTTNFTRWIRTYREVRVENFVIDMECKISEQS